jgi:hypothetical protein
MFRTSSVDPQEDLYMQWYGISRKQSVRWQDVLDTIKHILPAIDLLLWMHQRNTMKLHVQIFLRTNTWKFEIC